MKKIVILYVMLIVVFFTSCVIDSQKSINNNVESLDETCWMSELCQSETFQKDNMSNKEYTIDGITYTLKYNCTIKDSFRGEVDWYKTCDTDISMNIAFKDNVLKSFYSDDLRDKSQTIEKYSEEQAIEKAKEFLKSEGLFTDNYIVSIEDSYYKTHHECYYISFKRKNAPEGFIPALTFESLNVGISYYGTVFSFKGPFVQNVMEQYDLTFDIEEIDKKLKQQAIDIVKSKVECTDNDIVLSETDFFYYAHLEYTEEIGPCVIQCYNAHFVVNGENESKNIIVCVPVGKKLSAE